MAEAMELPAELPYVADYAKSSRAKCRECKSEIDKGELRIGFMVQNVKADMSFPTWFHKECFFLKHSPNTVGDIDNFEQLRFKDQELIKKKIEKKSTGVKKGKAAGKDFLIAYAKSNRSTCQACDEKIDKGAIRVSKKDYESEDAIRFGRGNGLDRWHCLECFVKIRGELRFFESGKVLPGFKDLDKDDQVAVSDKLPAIKPTEPKATNGEGSSGKRKHDEKSNGESSKRSKTENSEEKALRKQNDQMYKYRDALMNWAKVDLQKILRSNKQEVPPAGPDGLLDRITDIMTFGALAKCPKCKNGQYVFKSGIGYQCMGDYSEYAKCMTVTQDPERLPFKIPKDFREMAPFVTYKFKPQTRIIQKIAPSSSAAGSSSVKQKPKLSLKPLKNFAFYIVTGDKLTKEKWTNKIVEFGGKVNKAKSAKVAAFIATQADMDSNSKDIKYAETKGLPVVKGEFVDNLRELNFTLTAEMNKNLISNWIQDVTPWLKTVNKDYEEKKPETAVRRDKFEKKEKMVTLMMKDGAVVDPDSGGLEMIGHVLKFGNKGFYNCVLSKTSVEQGRNSYYKMQIIESDNNNEYWVFQSWGRIGTTIGSNKLIGSEEPISKDEAILTFCAKYEDLTGNHWGTSSFQKLPGRYTQLELDYGEKEHLKKLVPTQTSTLPIQLQELICLIFDVDKMKKAMLEFDLDLDKNPLGKLSRKHILEAYAVLNEASNLIMKSNDDKEMEIILFREVTNKFYTMIPHNFGTRGIQTLNDSELVKQKLEMLENLLEIELAYELLLEGDKGGETSIESHYKTLNASIDPVETGSEEFALLSKYLKNTHAETHSGYSLEIENVFKVNRNGERRKFAPFKNLHNRKLLWHGSRTTNFAGIISQGLRIAPKEAPATGYMFGKGVYFADMVSKSANYCFATQDNNTGLLILCDVALGDSHELKDAKENLPKGMKKGCHSVKGLGKTEPDPSETITLDDGVVVPLGKPVPSNVKDSALLYNEYIVYDTAQVNIKYLMKVNFNFNSNRRN